MTSASSCSTPAASGRDAREFPHSIEFSGGGPSSLLVALKCLGLPPCWVMYSKDPITWQEQPIGAFFHEQNKARENVSA